MGFEWASAHLGERELPAVHVGDGDLGDRRAGSEHVDCLLDGVDRVGGQERRGVGGKEGDVRPFLGLAAEEEDALAVLVEDLRVDPLADLLGTLRLVSKGCPGGPSS